MVLYLNYQEGTLEQDSYQEDLVLLQEVDSKLWEEILHKALEEQWHLQQLQEV